MKYYTQNLRKKILHSGKAVGEFVVLTPGSITLWQLSPTAWNRGEIEEKINFEVKKTLEDLCIINRRIEALAVLWSRSKLLASSGRGQVWNANGNEMKQLWMLTLFLQFLNKTQRKSRSLCALLFLFNNSCYHHWYGITLLFALRVFTFIMYKLRNKGMWNSKFKSKPQPRERGVRGSTPPPTHPKSVFRWKINIWLNELQYKFWKYTKQQCTEQ